MLKSSGGRENDGRGLVAKVADFGLAVKIDTNEDQTHMSNMYRVGCEEKFVATNLSFSVSQLCTLSDLTHPFLRLPAACLPPACRLMSRIWLIPAPDRNVSQG